ncbi:MAG: hypothetical protein JKY03_00600, partial [Aureispira sp.]|nr:hypothetical protein [Aureispira sp.]
MKTNMKLILLPLFILLFNGFSFAQCTGEDVRGDALDFDGSNDYVNTTYGGILGGNSRTIEAW